MKKIGLFVMLIGALGTLSAQHQAMFTQYMFNATAINPATVGSHETLSLTMLAREQWVGIEGAPSTQTLALHAPMNQDKIAAGILIMRDRIGVSSQTAAFVSGAYRILFAKSTLSMGIQLGFSQYNADLTLLNPNNPDIDASIRTDNRSSFLPNVGTGFYWYSDRFYVGISAPLLLNNFIDNDFGDIQVENNRPDLERHYFGMAGYVFDISPSLKFRPSMLMKMVEGAPIEFDFNANFLFDDVLWLGVSYRSFDSVSGLAEVQISDAFRVGYAYDFTVSDLGQFTSGSHELMINYRFSFRRDRVITPRYF
ncbi:MAG: type IX secretion system membrane protein PorP/SprF [Cytophagales bacterium]|nr:type IX secretion system membrane protein PorP/SprF [Cytophagales bacterium]